MNEDLQRIRKDLRIVKAWALVTTLILGVVLLTGWKQPVPKERFTELDVERFNVVSADGKRAVVISNANRMPGNVMGGKEYPRQGSRGSGLLFYNAAGNEAGGLIFDSGMSDTAVDAFGQLSLDRFGSDQVATLRYAEGQGGWNAGLQVSHFVRNALYEWFAANDSIMKLPPGNQETAREALVGRFVKAGKWEIPRGFVGEEGRTAILEMRDTKGHTRIRLSVDSSDVPRLQVLDSKGKIVKSILD